MRAERPGTGKLYIDNKGINRTRTVHTNDGITAKLICAVTGMIVLRDNTTQGHIETKRPKDDEDRQLISIQQHFTPTTTGSTHQSKQQQTIFDEHNLTNTRH